MRDHYLSCNSCHIENNLNNVIIPKNNSSFFSNDHSKIISSDLITNETSLLSTKPSLPANYLPAHSNSLKNTENLINTNTVSLTHQRPHQ